MKNDRQMRRASRNPARIAAAAVASKQSASEARLLDELSDARLLHRISTELIQEKRPEALYQQIVAAAAQLMRSDAATIQEYMTDSKNLRLLAHVGLQSTAIARWRRVPAGAERNCGAFLDLGTRTVIADLETCDFLAGTQILSEYRKLGIRAVQRTPLVSRGGQAIGLISTYWHERHEPSEADLSLLDVLSRQAADLIERAQVHQALRANEERWRRVLDTDAIGVLVFDRAGILIDANKAFLQATGYSRADLARRRLSWRSMTPPEWLDESEHQFAKLARSGRIGPYEKEYLCRNGRKIWLMFAGRSLADGSVVEYCIDITARKRAEDALRESEERFRQFAEASTDVLWIADARERRLEYVSPAYEAIWGEPPDHAVGNIERWAEIVHPEDRPRASEGRIRLLSEGRLTQEYRIVRPVDGEVRWIRDTSFAIRDESGVIIRLAGIAHDVTSEKRSAAALRDARLEAERANQAKSEFLAKMSHDMRTPLNGIIGMSELALLHVKNPKVREYLELAKSAAWRLSDLISDILDIARIEAGRITIEHKPFRLREEVEAALATLRPLAEIRGLDLRLRIDPGVPQEVTGDAGRLRQVITNLVGNAIKFTLDGAVALSVHTDHEVIFGVSDTGAGIPEDQLARIFESFVQVGTTAHAGMGGTGLGLAISKQLVELMGGRIWVESVLGKGSHFSFSLPLDRAAESESSPTPSSADPRLLDGRVDPDGR